MVGQVVERTTEAVEARGPCLPVQSNSNQIRRTQSSSVAVARDGRRAARETPELRQRLRRGTFRILPSAFRLRAVVVEGHTRLRPDRTADRVAVARAVVPGRTAPEARQVPGTTEEQAQAVASTMALAAVGVPQVLAETVPLARLGDRAGLRTRGSMQPCMEAVVVAETQRQEPTAWVVPVSAAMGEA